MMEEESRVLDKLTNAGSHADRKLHFTLIAGPTASGKSALALALAEERGAIIVNADSMQVYAELRVLTARPSPVDEARVPHRLYGTRSAREAYSVADWLRDIAPLVEAARNSGPPLVIIGGTGLYFKALTEGLSPVPDISDEVRQYWREAARRQTPEALHAELAQRDPAMASRLRPSDPQRIVRALEVIEATGRSLSSWQETAGEPLLRPEEADKFFIAPPREALYARIDARLDAMIAEGALAEVEALLALDLPPDRPALRAHGVPWFGAYLKGEMNFSAALERAKSDTRHYAKRQLTWARRNMIAWKTILAQ